MLWRSTSTEERLVEVERTHSDLTLTLTWVSPADEAVCSYGKNYAILSDLIFPGNSYTTHNLTVNRRYLCRYICTTAYLFYSTHTSPCSVYMHILCTYLHICRYYVYLYLYWILGIKSVLCSIQFQQCDTLHFPSLPSQYMYILGTLSQYFSVELIHQATVIVLTVLVLNALNTPRFV